MCRRIEDIVFVIPNLQGGGAERVVLTLCKGFYRYLHIKCHIIVFNTKKDYDIKDVQNIYPYSFNKKDSKREKARKLDAFILQKTGNMPKAVFSNLTEADKILKYSELPVFHIIHSTPSISEWGKKKGINRIFAWWKTKCYYNKHPSICVSMGVLLDFKKYINRRALCIYNPIDKDDIIKQSNAFIPEYKDYILAVGTCNNAKNRPLLIQSYLKLNTNKKLIIIGRQGSMSDTCMQLIKNLKLESKVIFTGFKKNPYPYIKYADLFVLSSDYEGLSMSLLEAITLGTPVISTDCPSGPAEIIGNNTHCLTPAGNIDKLSNAIKKALQNPHLYRIPLPSKVDLEYVCKQYEKLWKCSQ